MSFIDIADHQIHLWTTAYDDISDEQLLKHYFNLLNEAEVNKLGRFRFPKDQRQYLITRALLKTVLSLYHTDVQKTDWVFSYSPKGKPDIANQSLLNPVQFNLAHTDGMVVLAISKQTQVGIDVENLDRSGAFDDIANRYFSEKETAAIANLPLEKKHKRFFELWTLKESYVKAVGQGLSIPLDQISFELDQSENIQFMIDSNLGDSTRHWNFWQFMYAQKYLIAVSNYNPGKTVMNKISFRHIIPLVEYQTYLADDLRCS